MSLAGRFDAILFDVGGTLLRVSDDPQVAAYHRHVRDGGVSLEAFRACLDAAVADWRAAGGEAHREDLSETWVRHYERALSAAGFRGDCAATAHQIEASFLVDGWDVYPDVVPALDALLACGNALGIVSNWPSSLQNTLTTAALARYFSVVVSSGDVGYAKARAEIFEYATSQLQVDLNRVL